MDFLFGAQEQQISVLTQTQVKKITKQKEFLPPAFALILFMFYFSYKFTSLPSFDTDSIMIKNGNNT